VAVGESAASLIVRAASTVDPGKSGTAAVSVASAPASVSGVSVSPASATVIQGGTQTFTAAVAGTGGPAQTVTWSVEGAAAAGTAINSSGVLTVAGGESAKSLTVRAASTVDSGKSGTATVTVKPAITVSGVSVSPAAASVIQGRTQTFTAAVTGTGSPAQTVTWSVEGAAVSGTAISANGVLTVAEGETAKSLTVRAASTVDSGKSGAATVTVRPKNVTVTFHKTGGGSTPSAQTLTTDGKAADPEMAFTLVPEAAAEGLYRDVMNWYSDAACTAVWDFNAAVTQNLDLYTDGTAAVNLGGQSGAHTLAKALNYIAAQTLTAPARYTVVLAGSYPMAGVDAANIKTANAVITLVGKGPTEISLSSNGSLFRINAGKLILDNNITLKGRSENNRSLVYVGGSSASLLMKAGAKITGNSSNSFGGGGVFAGGSFVMEGGEISGNSVGNGGGEGGGGVYVSGSFVMKGGEISGNSANGNSFSSAKGGGV
jgi:hypothetical protein